MANTTWGFTPCWYKNAPSALSQSIKAVLVFCLLFPLTAIAQQPHHLRIRIINAQTNKPIHDEHLNVALKTDQVGSVAMATDKNGIILVDTGHATTIRILANMYADCRPRAELYTDYSIDTIRHSGITTGNLCGGEHHRARPGELLLYEIPKTHIPTYPHPPVSSMPHSDENPHTPNKPQ
ncbi:MAG: hypothetical protein ACRD3K_05225 [Edaphobacter sp.]